MNDLQKKGVAIKTRKNIVGFIYRQHYADLFTCRGQRLEESADQNVKPTEKLGIFSVHPYACRSFEHFARAVMNSRIFPNFSVPLEESHKNSQAAATMQCVRIENYASGLQCFQSGLLVKIVHVWVRNIPIDKYKHAGRYGQLRLITRNYHWLAKTGLQLFSLQIQPHWYVRTFLNENLSSHCKRDVVNQL